MRYLLLVILILVADCLQSQSVFMTSNPRRTAGDSGSVGFQIDDEKRKPKSLRLVVFHNFGITAETGEVNDCIINFALPTGISNQSGEFALRLYNENDLIFTQALMITADTTQTPIIEAFCGPKQILTGGEDHTAIVSTTLDSSDNPWPSGTKTKFDYVFKDRIWTKYQFSKPIYSYEKFFSDEQSGTAVVSAQSAGGTHQEFELTLYPNFPENFIIRAERNHSFADGKQISRIVTSQIIDRFGNTTPDGTLVNFKIESNGKVIEKGVSRTISGVAVFKTVAPALPSTWQIEAYIDQYAKSDLLEISYQKSIMLFDVKVLENTKIVAGPITSFVGQLVSDHTLVNIDIFQNNEKHSSLKTYTINGMAMVDLTILNLEPCTYEVLISCGGVEKRVTLSNYAQE